MKQSVDNIHALDEQMISQDDRLNAALLPSYVKIDGRTLVDRLVYFTAYGNALPFYNIENEQLEGSWANLFLKNGTTSIAFILSINIEWMDEIYNYLRYHVLEKLKYKLLEKSNIIFTTPIDDIYNDEKFNFFHILDGLEIDYIEIYTFIFELLKKIEDWYQNIKQLLDDDNKFILKIETLLNRKIVSTLKKFIYHINAVSNQSENNKEKIQLNELPLLLNLTYQSNEDVENIFSLIVISSNNNLQVIIEAGFDNVLDDLDVVYQNLRSIIIELQKLSEEILKYDLEYKNDHPPEFGLFLTFLKLFEEPQNYLNQLSQKHLNYYYMDWLGIPFIGDVPDEVFIYFELIETVNSYLLPKGTPLLATPTEDGITPVYETTSDVVLNHSTIESVKTIYISKDDNNQTIGIYDAPVANSQNGLGEAFKDDIHWPTFGEAQKDKPEGEQNMETSQIGIEIASPTLFLKEGKRNISIQFIFSTEARANHFPFCILKEFIQTSISTADGWLDISNYSTTTSNYITNINQSADIQIDISLPLDFPPVTNFTADEEKTYQSSDNPRIRILVSPNNIPNIYHYFDNKKLKNININVEVSEMQQMPLFNENGPFDTSTPFQIFGAAPLLNSYLAIGASELFQKNVNKLLFDFEWSDLPRALDADSNQISFQEYYQYYPFEESITDTSFKFNISKLEQTTFIPFKQNDDNNEIIESLFVINQEDGHISFNNHIVIEGEDLITPQSDVQPIINYTTSTQTGVIQLQLKQPTYGFGSSLYLPTINEIAQENAQIMSRRQMINMDFTGRGIYIPQGTNIPINSVLPQDYTIQLISIENKEVTRKTIIPQLEQDYQFLQEAIELLKKTTPQKLSYKQKQILKKLEIFKEVYISDSTTVAEGTNISKMDYSNIDDYSKKPLLPANTQITPDTIIPHKTSIPIGSIILYFDDPQVEIDTELFPTNSKIYFLRSEQPEQSEQLVSPKRLVAPKQKIIFSVPENLDQDDRTINSDYTVYADHNTIIEFISNSDSTTVNIYGARILPDTRSFTIDRDSIITFDKCNFLITSISQDFQIAPETNISSETNIIKGTNIPSVKSLPRSPFIPTLKSFKMGYNASETINFDQVPLDMKASPSNVFHIYPFGERLLTYDDQKLPYMFPHFDNDGYCYLGLKNLLLPQEINIYFQLNQSKFASAINEDKPTISWHYLKNNEWMLFDEMNIKNDSTNDLINSGIITLELYNFENTNKASILPKEFYWIRASAKGNISIISDTEAINTQAVKARWRVDLQDNTHFNTSLPANSIESTQQEIPEILGIQQPFPSFGGRIRESFDTIDTYYKRTNELLRHKDRAITIWDFERLVLEEFPNVQFVQCFSRFTEPNAIQEAGKIVVMVIPESRNDGNTFAYPKVNMTTLEQIQSFLYCRTSIFSSIEVRNPFYQRLTVECQVDFYGHPGYYLEKLNQDLIDFLSPRSSNIHNINIRKTLTRQEVIYFILQLDYVKELDESTLLLLDDNRLSNEYNCASKTSNREITRCQPWFILDTVKQHKLSLITYSEQEQETDASSENLSTNIINEQLCQPFNNSSNSEQTNDYCLDLEDIE